MPGPMQTMSQTARKFWSVVYGRSTPAAPEVIVHDPAARRPHDLDDPFFDSKVQTRMADVIAATGNRKTKNSV